MPRSWLAVAVVISCYRLFSSERDDNLLYFRFHMTSCSFILAYGHEKHISSQQPNMILACFWLRKVSNFTTHSSPVCMLEFICDIRIHLNLVAISIFSWVYRFKKVQRNILFIRFGTSKSFSQYICVKTAFHFIRSVGKHVPLFIYLL